MMKTCRVVYGVKNEDEFLESEDVKRHKTKRRYISKCLFKFISIIGNVNETIAFIIRSTYFISANILP